MKKNKSKYIVAILFIIIGIGLIGSGVYLSNINPPSPKGDSKEKLSFELPEDSKLSIKNCKTEFCEMPETDYYNLLVNNWNYKLLTEKITKINQDTRNYYDQANKSTTDTEKCAAVKDLYFHEQRVITQYYNYENDKYVSIAVQRDIVNLCENKLERKKIEWYLYDKKNNKLLSQVEFKNKENITSEEITAATESVIKTINDEEKLNIIPQKEYDDVVYFYDFQGNILISFYVPEKNTYYAGTIRNNSVK